MRISDWSSDVCSSDLAKSRLDRLALEPAIEHRARRLGEQVEHVALRFEAETREAPPLPRAVDQRAQPLADVRRDAEREIAEQLGDIFERVIIARQHLGIARREFAELDLRAFEPAAELEIPPILLRQEIADRPPDHAITVIGELHELGRASCRERVCQYV